MRRGNDLVWIIAPRDFAARRIADPHRPWPAIMRSFRLTSSERLRHFVERHTQRVIGDRAAESLHRSQPLFSNAPSGHGVRLIKITVALSLALAFLAVAPLAAIEGLSGLLCALFLGASALRLMSACFTADAPKRLKIDDTKLPIYTIICALYHEAPVVKKLVAAIRAIDYPPEKLDVKFLLEADDKETQAALGRLALGPPFEVIIAPPSGPRTKPRGA